MLTAVPLLTECALLYNFSSRQRPFHSAKSNFSEVSLVHCNIRGVIRQQVY